jgi:hypothetical protein
MVKLENPTGYSSSTVLQLQWNPMSYKKTRKDNSPLMRDDHEIERDKKR